MLVYRGYLHDEGVAVESDQADKLKVRLLRHFRSQLCFHQPQKRNESQYVFSSAVPPGSLVEHCLQLQAAAERSSSAEDMSMIDIVDEIVTTNREDASEASTIFAAAVILRRELLSLKTKCPFHHIPQILVKLNSIPVCLYNFLCWIVCGDQSC